MMEEYFDSVHWFSLVIYEPRFRSKFESVQDGFAYPWQKGFLLLLSTVIGMGAWYKSHKNETDTDSLDEDSRGWALSRDWAQSLIQGAGSQLPELMDQSSIASVQCCILLGSYYVYHGKPNLAFALLGATIKTAQAIGLHRQPLRGDFESIEERKRVWWTIYTWDRYVYLSMADMLLEYMLIGVDLLQSPTAGLLVSTTKIAMLHILMIRMNRLLLERTGVLEQRTQFATRPINVN
jgi:hypothetical protein